MENEKIDSFRIVVQSGNASFKEIMGVYVALNDLYVSMGGLGLQFNLIDVVNESVPESDYDVHVGTPFANTRRVRRESDFPKYVPREEVYDAIKEFIEPSHVSFVKKSLDDLFPEDKFQGCFPYSRAMEILFNDYIC